MLGIEGRGVESAFISCGVGPDDGDIVDTAVEMTGDGVDGATKTGCISGIVVLIVGDAVSGTGVVCTIVGGTDIVVGEVVGGGDPVTASVGAEVEGSVEARVGADVSLAVESPPNVLETSSRVAVLPIISVNGIAEYHSSRP
jgi:hypothetical protein